MSRSHHNLITLVTLAFPGYWTLLPYPSYHTKHDGIKQWNAQPWRAAGG